MNPSRIGWFAALTLAFLVTSPLAAPESSPAGTEAGSSSGPVNVTALAVEETSQGFVGVHADVSGTVLSPGTGKVYVSTKPLAQTDMQGSARLASQVAASTLGANWRAQDYLVSFSSESTVIGGPSAGAVMTLALTTALHNLLDPQAPWTLDPTVAGTGTINPDGTIGPVGGIPAKAEGAKQAGITTFLYPAGMDVATTEVGGPLGLHSVSVDMATHCASLGISCHGVASIRDFIAAAAHVQLSSPAVPTPGTVDYASLLGPGVKSQVDALSARLDAATSNPAVAQLQAGPAGQVNQQLSNARTDLSRAQDSIAKSLYYEAATQAFQGSIAVGFGENLTAFYAKGRSEDVVRTALSACENATAAADVVNGESVTTLNALYAVGAAQERAKQADNLREQARSFYQNAATFSDWLSSMQASTFCTERAHTVMWWAGLRDVFSNGPAVADLATLAQDALDQATELVSYASAVLSGGGAGTSTALTDAQTKLQDATAHQQAGQLAGAAVEAVEAQTLASAAVQTGGGAPVPDAVLQNATASVERAVDAAHRLGAEPMLSVSLFELAQGETDASARLQDLWNARGLALLGVESGSTPPQETPIPRAATESYSDGTLVAFLVMGVVVGLAASSIILVALMARRSK
jgi:uncharacterized protein